MEDPGFSSRSEEFFCEKLGVHKFQFRSLQIATSTSCFFAFPFPILNVRSVLLNILSRTSRLLFTTFLYANKKLRDFTERKKYVSCRSVSYEVNRYRIIFPKYVRNPSRAKSLFIARAFSSVRLISGPPLRTIDSFRLVTTEQHKFIFSVQYGNQSQISQ